MSRYEPVWPGGPSGNESGFTFFFSRQEDIEHNLTDTDDRGVHEDLIHTPDEGTGVSMIVMRRQALHTLSAIAGLSFVVVFLRYLQ